MSRFRILGVLFLLAATLGGCAAPMFVRTSAQTEGGVRFLVGDGSDQYIVQCDRQEAGGALTNCRNLPLSFSK